MEGKGDEVVVVKEPGEEAVHFGDLRGALTDQPLSSIENTVCFGAYGGGSSHVHHDDGCEQGRS